MSKKKPTKSEIIRERWLRGRLNYKLHAGQIKIENLVNSHTEQLIVGELARQFGKSFWLVKKALEVAHRIPNARIKFATAFLTDLEEFILPAFEIIMADCPEDIRPVFKTHGSKFVCHNGSQIKLVGLDRKPNGLRGNTPDLIIIDECGFVSRLDYIYKSVIIPATTHRPDCKVLLFSTPPDTPAHEFLDYVQKAEAEGGYLKLTIYDNPIVNEATIERLKKESGGEHTSTWKREYLCLHVTDDKLAIVEEWQDIYCQEIATDAYYNFYHRYLAMDLGIKDHTAVIYAYYDFKRAQLIVIDEYIVNGPEMTTKSLQAEIKNIELRLWSQGHEITMVSTPSTDEQRMKNIESAWDAYKPNIYMRVSDNNNPLLLQDLSHLHKIHFTATDKGRLEEMVNTLKIMVRSGGLIVHPRCKQTLGCLKYGVWDKKREKFAHSKVFGHFDALAALIYLVRNLDKITNPIPNNFQLDTDNQILFARKTESQSAKDMRSAFGLNRK